jgi:hypothetical protein
MIQPSLEMGESDGQTQWVLAMSMAKVDDIRARSRTFSATERDFQMLEAISRYHGTSKSAGITGLIRKEFWRVFPHGTDSVTPDRGAKVNHE